MIDPQRALEEWLDRVLAGEVSVDELRREHAELGSEALHLLAVAERVWLAGYRAPDAASLEQGRLLLLQAIPARPISSARPRWDLAGWFGAIRPAIVARAAATAVAALVLAGGGVTLAASQSGPDSVLYPYRLALEETRANFAPERDKPALYLDFAEQRLTQLTRAAAMRPETPPRGDPTHVDRAALAYAQALERGVRALEETKRSVPPARVQQLKDRYEATLAAQAGSIEVATASARALAAPVLSEAAATALVRLDEVRGIVVPTPAPIPTPAGP
ncbi:MAG: hypothetical protein FJ029_10960, partial [Actinobacteria bacterium]|nr:hypothetical protein [Actinomycetota bacterium]